MKWQRALDVEQSDKGHELISSPSQSVFESRVILDFSEVMPGWTSFLNQERFNYSSAIRTGSTTRQLAFPRYENRRFRLAL